jgi:hypothetical protein
MVMPPLVTVIRSGHFDTKAPLGAAPAGPLRTALKARPTKMIFSILYSSPETILG